MSMRFMIPSETSIERRHSSSDFRYSWHLPHFRASGWLSAPQVGHFRVSAMASPSYRLAPTPGSPPWYKRNRRGAATALQQIKASHYFNAPMPTKSCESKI
jgi:hypothetical protein